MICIVNVACECHNFACWSETSIEVDFRKKTITYIPADEDFKEGVFSTKEKHQRGNMFVKPSENTKNTGMERIR